MSERAAGSSFDRAGGGVSGIFAAEGSVLRFYLDGTVLEATIAPQEVVGAHIEKWLRKEAPFAETRFWRYRLDDEHRVTFQTSDYPKGTVIDLDGIWHDEELALELRSGSQVHGTVVYRRIA